MRIAVFGLGEAGSVIAADLTRAGVEVHGYDPAEVDTPVGVIRHDDPQSGVGGADLVLSITAAADARRAMMQAWGEVGPGASYADLATAGPDLKRELAGVAAERNVPFTDVALMAPVPGRGLATPALASGSGAEALAAMLNPLGGRLEVIDAEAGAAAARKLMRSVVTKGMASLVLESMAAARATGQQVWAWNHIVELLTATGETFLKRLLDGTELHVERRLAEMEAAADFLEELDVPTDMTLGTIAALRRTLDLRR